MKNVFMAAALIVILGFAVYANSLNGEFIWDDNNLVKYNTAITNLSDVSSFFRGNIGAGAGVKYSFYRPVQMLTYAVDYSFWKLDTKGYHLTNIILHALAASCVFWLVSILFKDRRLALFTGVLFVVHPIHTTAVSYISSRADLLLALFMLSCFALYVKERYFFALPVYTLAILSKEAAIMLPAYLLFYHFAFRKPVKAKAFAPIAASAFAYILLRLTVLPFPRQEITTTLGQRAPGFFAAIANYIKLLILPLNLHIEYGNSLFRMHDHAAFFGLVIAAIALFGAVKIRKNHPVSFFGLCFFFIALLPYSNLFPINTFMSENWLYLPSIGFFLIAAKILSLLYDKKKMRIAAVGALTGLTAFYSFLTVKQNNYWSGPIAFYEKTIKHAPLSFAAHSNLGLAYWEKGQHEKAVELFKKSIRINPGYVEAYNNLGSIYNDMGKANEAIALYKEAIEINPSHPTTYNNLAATYYGIGEYALAIQYCDKAIELGCKVGPEFLKALAPYRSRGND